MEINTKEIFHSIQTIIKKVIPQQKYIEYDFDDIFNSPLSLSPNETKLLQVQQ